MPRRRLLAGIALLAAVGALLAVAVVMLRAREETPRVRATLSVAEALRARDDSGFARALGPRVFSFPRDHGPHPGYRTEWWYYTGNLRAADGRHFGYQLTFFRTALRPAPVVRASAWGASEIYMAHFALTDVAGGRFHAFERLSRDALGLAGATIDPGLAPRRARTGAFAPSRILRLASIHSGFAPRRARSAFAHSRNLRLGSPSAAPRTAAHAAQLELTRVSSRAGLAASLFSDSSPRLACGCGSHRRSPTPFGSNGGAAARTAADAAQLELQGAPRTAADAAQLDVRSFRVWLEDWSVDAEGPEAQPMRLHAAADGVAIDLTLRSAKPVVLQGERGFSQKGPEPGNASYYYSLTRMDTTGAIGVGGETWRVAGSSWMDREWSTSALGADQVGWDWFALQLDDGRDVMFYRLRHRDGSTDRWSRGTLVAPDGSTRRLLPEDVRIEAADTWRSPRSGAVYPSRWRFAIPVERLELEITPYLRDQELDLSVRYWEGSVRVSGAIAGRPVTGNGYVELTGY